MAADQAYDHGPQAEFAYDHIPVDFPGLGVGKGKGAGCGSVPQKWETNPCMIRLRPTVRII